MTAPPDLAEVKAIELLKARYCRLLDEKDWTGFRELFSDDLESDTTASGGVVMHGADEFVSFVRKALGDRVTVHHVQQPEIVMTSGTTANGVWAMQDVVRLGLGLTMHGFGHYRESYVKTDDRWRIKSTTLTRLREEIQTPLFNVFLSPRLKRGLARAARPRTGWRVDEHHQLGDGCQRVPRIACDAAAGGAR